MQTHMLGVGCDVRQNAWKGLPGSRALCTPLVMRNPLALLWAGRARGAQHDRLSNDGGLVQWVGTKKGLGERKRVAEIAFDGCGQPLVAAKSIPRFSNGPGSAGAGRRGHTRQMPLFVCGWTSLHVFAVLETRANGKYASKERGKKQKQNKACPTPSKKGQEVGFHEPPKQHTRHHSCPRVPVVQNS